jgi:hypothetical protein
VPTRRSRRRNVLLSTTDGIAKITMNAITSIDHTKSGMRLNDMPGARVLRMVAASSTATARPATSVK